MVRKFIFISTVQRSAHQPLQQRDFQSVGGRYARLKDWAELERIACKDDLNENKRKIFSLHKNLQMWWTLYGRLSNDDGDTNRPFPSSLVPLFQSESKCETIPMKMTLICMKMKLHAELILKWKVSHLVDSFWNRGTRELANGLLKICLVYYTLLKNLAMS